MFEKVILSAISLLLLSACNSYRPEIHSVCLRDDIGNYVIKWETEPVIDGTLKVHVSDDPDHFDKTSPVMEANIHDGVATYITNDNITRKYFHLSFNEKYHQTVGSRAILMDNVQNLRDMGGYYTGQNDKATRWGKIFRSGKLSRLSSRDTIRMDNLGIKTILDLRTEEEASVSPIMYEGATIVRIPVLLGNREEILRKIQEGRTLKGDAVLYMQDLYLRFVTENSSQFAKAMELFTNKDNYPILFNCSLGKDRAGFMAAILLLALGVPEEVVLQDYLISNQHLDLKRYRPLVRQLNTEAQETLTVLFTAKESFLGLALRKIDKDYGSFSNYLAKELNISEKQQNQLKEIMLF